MGLFLFLKTQQLLIIFTIIVYNGWAWYENCSKLDAKLTKYRIKAEDPGSI